jgi:hypothetical protein
MAEDGNYNAKVSGIAHAIYVSKRGVELIIENQSTPIDGATRSTCRLDRSVSHLDNMLQLAQTAFINKLPVSVIGYGDDRDNTLEFDEIRISGDADSI